MIIKSIFDWRNNVLVFKPNIFYIVKLLCRCIENDFFDENILKNIARVLTNFHITSR